jgi:hypothetical protein
MNLGVATGRAICGIIRSSATSGGGTTSAYDNV